MGGSLEVKSHLNVGSHFIFKIELKKVYSTIETHNKNQSKKFKSRDF